MTASDEAGSRAARLKAERALFHGLGQAQQCTVEERLVHRQGGEQKVILRKQVTLSSEETTGIRQVVEFVQSGKEKNALDAVLV